MDTPTPPPPSRIKLRPWYLVAAMVLTWFVGVCGLNAGVTYASFLHGGTMPDVAAATAEHAGTLAQVRELAGLEALHAMLGHARITFPLAVAEVILSGLLVVASGLAMGGRRGSRSLVLQAIGANALLAIVSYALTPAVRAAYIDGMLQAVGKVTLPPPQREMIPNASMMEWAFRIKLVVFDLGALGLGALALTRARAKSFFEAAARAAERTEEP